jgi:hypothetical protein
MSTNFSKTLLYQISQKLIQQFLSYYMQTDKHGKANGHIFCNFIMHMPKKCDQSGVWMYDHLHMRPA